MDICGKLSHTEALLLSPEQKKFRKIYLQKQAYLKFYNKHRERILEIQRVKRSKLY